MCYSVCNAVVKEIICLIPDNLIVPLSTAFDDIAVQ